MIKTYMYMTNDVSSLEGLRSGVVSDSGIYEIARNEIVDIEGDVEVFFGIDAATRRVREDC